MKFEDKEKAIQELIKEKIDGNFHVGCLEMEMITVYFKDEKENWINSFSGLLSQLGFKFSIMNINTVEIGDYRHSVTLIFDIQNIDESDFW